MISIKENNLAKAGCFFVELVVKLTYMKLERGQKRLIIIAIYLAIVFFSSWLVYSWTKLAPTCFDGKKNQNETEIDCGGICKACEKVYRTQDLIIKEKAFIPGSQGKYDVMARVSNPNNQVGGSSFSYEFVLKDGAGNALARKSGTSFILPVESKYIIETDLESEIVPREAEFSIGNVAWKEFFGYEKPELSISNQRYELISSGVGFSEAKGLLRNNSDFDFSLIKINIVLRGGSGEPVAFNKTEMRTISSGEERDFRLLWPVHFPGLVERVEMEASADVFNSENFIKKYTNSDIQQFQLNK